VYCTFGLFGVRIELVQTENLFKLTLPYAIKSLCLGKGKEFIFILACLNNNNSVQFLHLSACEQRVAYNRRALNVHVTKSKLRLELELN
jgi:hypothetical protein